MRVPAASSGCDVDGAVGVWRGERTMHLGVDQDRLPGHAGGGCHRRGLGLYGEIGRLMVEVDGAGSGCRQLAGVDAELGSKRVPRAVH